MGFSNSGEITDKMEQIEILEAEKLLLQ